VLQGVLALGGIASFIIGGVMIGRMLAEPDAHDLGGVTSAIRERLYTSAAIGIALSIGMLVGVVGAWRMRDWGRITMIVIAWGMIGAWALGGVLAVMAMPAPGPTKFPEMFQLFYWVLLIIVLRSEMVREAFTRSERERSAALPANIPPVATYS
jgi:hypothetical protein